MPNNFNTPFNALAASNYSSDLFEASGIIKSSSGILFGISGFYNGIVARFFQIYNSSGVPATGEVPVIVIRVGAKNNFSWNIGRARGILLSSGIFWTLSNQADSLVGTGTGALVCALYD